MILADNLPNFVLSLKAKIFICFNMVDDDLLIGLKVKLIIWNNVTSLNMVQCDAVITWSILSKIVTKDTA